MFVPGQRPIIRPKLIHPTHEVTIWKLDKEKTEFSPNINVITDIHYDSENPIVFPCQYKIPKFGSLERLQVSRIQGLFIKDVLGYILAHRDNIVIDGNIIVEKGDVIKDLREVNGNMQLPMEVFVSDVIPIGQYDIAYLFRIQIEDRELDETTEEPISATDPELATPPSNGDPGTPQIGPRI